MMLYWKNKDVEVSYISNLMQNLLVSLTIAYVIEGLSTFFFIYWLNGLSAKD